MAVEAGKRIKDAMMFVMAAFKSGQILELVASAMKLGFAIGVNALINGFRTAIEFFWNLLTDGAMWKSMGTTLLGLVAGFGAALLNAFQTPIVYLQSGMEWVIASLIKGLLKIPGMSDLLGMKEEDVQTDFGKILASRKESGAELFGFNFKELAAKADGLASSGAPDLAGRVAEAARKAGESAPSDHHRHQRTAGQFLERRAVDPRLDAQGGIGQGGAGCGQGDGETTRQRQWQVPPNRPANRS